MKMNTVFLAILLLGASGAAVADRDDGSRGERDSHVGLNRQVEARVDVTALQAPEIDPASWVAALTLLGGGLIVMRGRRPSKARV
ncbi:MAG: hypothetical protein ABSF94_17690 [Steroidobacteraceae bacterium]